MRRAKALLVKHSDHPPRYDRIVNKWSADALHSHTHVGLTANERFVYTAAERPASENRSIPESIGFDFKFNPVDCEFSAICGFCIQDSYPYLIGSVRLKWKRSKPLWRFCSISADATSIAIGIWECLLQQPTLVYLQSGFARVLETG